MESEYPAPGEFVFGCGGDVSRVECGEPAGVRQYRFPCAGSGKRAAVAAVSLFRPYPERRYVGEKLLSWAGSEAGAEAVARAVVSYRLYVLQVDRSGFHAEPGTAVGRSIQPPDGARTFR